MSEIKKSYIEYSYPDTERAAIVEVWITPQKPKKNKIKSGCVFVYDLVKNAEGKFEAINERGWDGVE